MVAVEAEAWTPSAGGRERRSAHCFAGLTDDHQWRAHGNGGTFGNEDAEGWCPTRARAPVSTLSVEISSRTSSSRMGVTLLLGPPQDGAFGDRLAELGHADRERHVVILLQRGVCVDGGDDIGDPDKGVLQDGGIWDIMCAAASPQDRTVQVPKASAATLAATSKPPTQRGTSSWTTTRAGCFAD